jgi:hypothetical protein
MSENKRGAEKKASAEDAWEKAGYLRSAAESAVNSAADSGADSATDIAIAAYARGKARWEAEHPEARE